MCKRVSQCVASGRCVGHASPRYTVGVHSHMQFYFEGTQVFTVCSLRHTAPMQPFNASQVDIPEASMQKHNRGAALRMMHSQCLAHTLSREPILTLLTSRHALSSIRCFGKAPVSNITATAVSGTAFFDESSLELYYAIQVRNRPHTLNFVKVSEMLTRRGIGEGWY